jgi:hypothetical protein
MNFLDDRKTILYSNQIVQSDVITLGIEVKFGTNRDTQDRFERMSARENIKII